METRGGAREGAGRPKGVKNKISRDLRDLLSTVITEDEIASLFRQWMDSGDYKKQLSVIEYVYGKPPQSVDMTSRGDKISGWVVEYIDKTDDVDDEEDSGDESTEETS